MVMDMDMVMDIDMWMLTTGLSQFLLMWVSLPFNMVTDFHQHKKEIIGSMQERSQHLHGNYFSNTSPLFCILFGQDEFPRSASIQGGKDNMRAQIPGSWVHWVCAVDTCGSQ